MAEREARKLRVLWATDGSESSRSAAPLLRELVLPAAERLVVLAVAPHSFISGARPDPAALDNYQYDRLIGDVLDLAAACGCDSGRFHLVGHDWGGQVAWGVADRHPDRLASLTILSRPHPASFVRALQAPDSDQKHRSRHHRAFLDPATAHTVWIVGATLGALFVIFVGFLRRRWFRRAPDQI